MNWDVLGLQVNLFFRTSLVTNYVTNKIHGSCLLFIALFIADLFMVINVDMCILCSNLCVVHGVLHLNTRLFADGMWKCIVCRE